MGTRVPNRIEVRLDEEHREMLDELMAESESTISIVVRRAIEREHGLLRGQKAREKWRALQEDGEDWGSPEELEAEIQAAWDADIDAMLGT